MLSTSFRGTDPDDYGLERVIRDGESCLDLLTLRGVVVGGKLFIRRSSVLALHRDPTPRPNNLRVWGVRRLPNVESFSPSSCVTERRTKQGSKNFSNNRKKFNRKVFHTTTYGRNNPWCPYLNNNIKKKETSLTGKEVVICGIRDSYRTRLHSTFPIFVPR